MEPSEAEYWLDGVASDVAVRRFRDLMDQKYASQRPQIERRLKQEMFGTDGRLSAADQRKLDDAVDEELGKMDADERAQQVPAFRTEFREGLLPMQWLDWVAITLKADRRDASITLDGELELD